MRYLAPEIERNAERLRVLHLEIHKTFQERPHGKAHQAACEAFHDAFDQLAFPGGLANGLEKLKARDPDTIEDALQFLECDPFFHRSGYIKEKLIRRLKHCELTEPQRKRAINLILRGIDRGFGKEFWEYSRLAGVLYSPRFLALIKRRTTGRPQSTRRAIAVLNVWRSQGKITDENHGGDEN